MNKRICSTVTLAIVFAGSTQVAKETQQGSTTLKPKNRAIEMRQPS